MCVRTKEKRKAERLESILSSLARSIFFRSSLSSASSRRRGPPHHPSWHHHESRRQMNHTHNLGGAFESTKQSIDRSIHAPCTGLRFDGWSIVPFAWCVPPHSFTSARAGASKLATRTSNRHVTTSRQDAQHSTTKLPPPPSNRSLLGPIEGHTLPLGGRKCWSGLDDAYAHAPSSLLACSRATEAGPFVGIGPAGAFGLMSSG